VRDIVRVCQQVFSEAAILGIAAELRLRAHRFPRVQTVVALTTSGIEPRHADAVALFNDSYARADRGHTTDGFMTWDERQRGFYRPVAISGVEIRVADPAGFGFDQDLPWAGRRYIAFLERQRLAELLDNRGVHFVLP